MDQKLMVVEEAPIDDGLLLLMLDKEQILCHASEFAHRFMIKKAILVKLAFQFAYFRPHLELHIQFGVREIVFVETFEQSDVEIESAELMAIGVRS